MSTDARSGTTVSSLALALGSALALAGCPDAHMSGGDAGSPPGDAGGTVIHDCLAAVSAASGAACDFSRTCFADGRTCDSSLTLRCVDGLLVIERDVTCDAGVLSDAGPPPIDGGVCAPDEPSFGAGCRSDADCATARWERCIAPGENPGCGVCRIPTRDCETDADCSPPDASPGICHEFVDPCSTFGGGIACGPGGDPTSSICIPRCEAAGCPEGQACASDGRCAPVRCGAEYTCPAGTACASGAGVGDAHGCERLSCASDADCPCGTGCVEGACHPVLGVCEPPRA